VGGLGVVKRLRQGYRGAGMLGVAQEQCDKGSPQTRVAAMGQPKYKRLDWRGQPFMSHFMGVATAEVADPGVTQLID
jgi:hypothetical protein